MSYNPEKQRVYRRANAERYQALNAAWYRANPEWNQAKAAAWRKANPEKSRANTAAWRRANPEKQRAQGADKRARKAAAFVETVNHEAVFIRDGGVCQICDKFIGVAPWHIDHRIPLSKGGKHSYANCQLSHAICNQHKAASIGY